MKNIFFGTLANFGFQKSWFIICDDKGKPIKNVKDAKEQMQKNFPKLNWGIANKEQMLLGNAMQDNF